MWKVRYKNRKDCHTGSGKLGLSLVDVEYMQDGGYWYVRIYVEKLDGDVNLEDCANLSGNIEDAVDQLIDKNSFWKYPLPELKDL